MEQETVISKNILENMSDGVMTIDLTGQIITFNPAAANILGLSRGDVMGRKFAQVFFEHEGNDNFNQAILDAIYESSVSHNRTVDFNTGRKVISLSLTTSFLQSSDGGEVKKIGVIAVFSDVTEVKKLRDAETRLTEQIKVSHKELQDAYLKMEEGNKNLEVALKKVQMVRVAATVFAIVLFLAIGLFTWNKKLLPGGKRQAQSAGTGAPKIFTVMSAPVSSSLSLAGSLEPLHIVNITSPLSGKVKEMNVRYGDIVKAGQLLLSMDTTEVEMKAREAKAAYIKAAEHLREIEDWDNSTEVARARRSLTKAKLTLENQKKLYEETERLYKKGIVPATEFEGTRQQYAGQQLDYQSAQEEIQAVLAKGNDGNKKIARLEMENALARMREMEAQQSQARVTAPVSGVILVPSSATEAKNGKFVEKGTPLQQGEILFSIGDLKGFSVKTATDEVDVTKIREGQRVTVTGDAFQGISLTGQIHSISSQAGRGKDPSAGGAPSFDVTVAVDELTPEQRQKIFVGMSAVLDVIIYEKQDALMVPVSAVETEGAKHFVKKVTSGKGAQLTTEKIEVQTGYTTIDNVEIISGLKAGDEVLF